jgi:hypothetical protein
MIKAILKIIRWIIYFWLGNKQRIESMKEKKEKQDKEILAEINRRTGRHSRKRIYIP